jgi:HsdM N-terminal domain
MNQTVRRLEDHLWQAADLFRNKVSNQKDYILALLFFNRASDLYKEELEAALESAFAFTPAAFCASNAPVGASDERFSAVSGGTTTAADGDPRDAKTRLAKRVLAQRSGAGVEPTERGLPRRTGFEGLRLTPAPLS